MFKKFFKFLYGYVIIKVYGKGAERFINICLRRNIDVWNIKPFDDGIEMCIYIKDFFHIRQVRKKSNAFNASVQKTIFVFDWICIVYHIFCRVGSVYMGC